MSAHAVVRHISFGLALAMTAVLCAAMASPAAALSLMTGQRVFAVVVRGTETKVEPGQIIAVEGGMARVRWDACACETHVPVDELLASPAQARTVEERLDADRVTFAEAAGSAGRMSLLFLLFGRPVRR